MTTNASKSLTPAEIAELARLATKEGQSLADYLAACKKLPSDFEKQMNYAHDLLMDGADGAQVRDILLMIQRTIYSAHSSVRTPQNRYWLDALLLEAEEAIREAEAAAEAGHELAFVA